MKYTITKSQKNIIQVLRNTQEEWMWIKEIVEEGLDIFNPCDYSDGESYVNKLSVDGANTYLYNYLDDWQTKEFRQLSEYISSLIRERLSEFILDYYKSFVSEECD
jgi:hypothetical protein